ncbi:MAG TPA: hypothetical protein VKZ79_22390 [Alphaproteobacteria bacterium]|nr:hypothetical protein [Alphaproteobacteria bacterium]
MTDHAEMPEAFQPSLAIPLIIGLLAFVLFLAFQTSQILSARSVLALARANQNGPMEEASKARRQLDTIANRTAELAAKGNTNAQAIVADLARQGIQINTAK